ncbi:zinc ribbon domain-containing protein [Natrarchaeobius sp. A-rgal3]|uniref:zinc ribbon domain-containing protein n=1 Tax=Natrarchaeobius versutus TaxID=1679078 RepID=UPI003510C499
MANDRTAIGVDIGEYNLYTACPATIPDDTGAYAVDGDDVCAELDELRAQAAALLGSDYGRETIVAYVRDRRDALLEEIDEAAQTICEYATQSADPVLVTEDSNHETDLWAWLTDPDAHRGTAWLIPAAHRRLRWVAAEYGLEVVTVPERYSSQECHACGVIGARVQSQTFHCTNPDCHVETIDADANAAAVLARRYYPGRQCAYRPTRPVAPADRPAVLADGGRREHDA